MKLIVNTNYIIVFSFTRVDIRRELLHVYAPAVQAVNAI